MKKKISLFQRNIFDAFSYKLITQPTNLFTMENEINSQEWDKVMNEFRQTDAYRKSEGKNLFALFYEFLYTHYNSPTKITKK